MRVLILGYSSIVKRRVLQALLSVGVKAVDIASCSNSQSIVFPEGLSGVVFSNYSEALRHSQADMVYVSTVNSLHAELAALSLESDRHVVIDKPAAVELIDVEHLVELANEKGLLVAEATVYTYHPQIQAALKVFEDAGSRPTQLIAAFSFPPFPPENFRQQPELGGGAVLDLGPYAVSIGRVFFGDSPLKLISSGSYSAFSLLANYNDSRSLVGHFGMTTGYINRLEVLGADVTVTIDRAFTTTADMVCTLQVNQSNERRAVTVEPSDSFALFLKSVFESIGSEQRKVFAETMLKDAQALDILRHSLSA